MSRASQKKVRFNRYCLDDGDEFFEDVVCDYYGANPILNTETTTSSLSGSFFSSSRNAKKNFEVNRMKAQRGRLRLCARSLVFEPDDMQEPLRLIRFRDFVIADELEGIVLLAIEKSGGAMNAFTVECECTITQLKYGRVLPWTFDKQRQQHMFQIPFGDVVGFVNSLNTLISVETMEAHTHERQASMDKYIHLMESQRDFALTSLRSGHEVILTKVLAHRILPRIRIRGRVVLTNEYCYFQEIFPVDPPAVTCVKLKDIRRVERRRYALQETAIEIAMYDDTLLLLAFENVESCDAVFLCLAGKCSIDRLRVNDIPTMQQRWLQGAISNFDYLMYLNWMAGRTKNDLSQYPVLPWVVADYTSPMLDLSNPKTFRDLSLPLGALNPKRLQSFYNRMVAAKEMTLEEGGRGSRGGSGGSAEYLYSTHFSNPAYVAYFLVRRFPEYMLSLHGGKYDNPARMFESFPDCWESVNNSPTDLKELIPEFYSGDGSFLTSPDAYDLCLGTKPNGANVAKDVILPPWANSSPLQFVTLMRHALESLYVSTHLHDWIDLMFGYKQRGPAAKQAHNLFHPHTYESVTEVIRHETDPLQRLAIETHAMEVGQMPKQLFTTKHPQRTVATPVELISMDSHVAFDSDDLAMTASPVRTTPNNSMNAPPSDADLDASLRSGVSPMTSFSVKSPSTSFAPAPVSLSLAGSAAIHKTRIECVVTFPMFTSECQWWLDDDEDVPSKPTIVAASADVNGNIFFSNVGQTKRARSSPTVCGTVPLSCMCVTPASKDTQLAYIGSHNGNLYIVDVLQPPSAPCHSISAHSTGLTSIAYTGYGTGYLASASWNGSVRVWSLRGGSGSPTVTNSWDYDECVSMLDFSRGEGSLLGVLTTSGTIALYDLKSEHPIRQWKVDPNTHHIHFMKDEYIVTVCNNMIRLYDVHDGRLWSERTKEFAVRGVCTGPSSSQMVGYDDRGHVHLMGCATGTDECTSTVVGEDITSIHRYGEWVTVGHATGNVSFVKIG